MNISDLRPVGERIGKALRRMGVDALEAADRMSALADALRGEKPPVLPAPGDYIRITNELDLNCGEIGEVLDVENAGRPGRKTIHIKLSPFGEGGQVKLRRPIDPGCYKILCEMEVLAEASQ